MKTTRRASLEELLEFVNHVRVAGGASPVDNLMPGVPHDATRCLIAANMPFDCIVTQCGDGRTGWRMFVSDSALAHEIGNALGCVVRETPSLKPFVVLPKEIGALASAFDSEVIDADLLPYVDD